MKRVVITGAGAVSALGNGWDEISQALRARQNKIQRITDWDDITGLRTRLGAPITDFEVPAHYPRKTLRSMGRGSVMAVRASEMALEQAGLVGSSALTNGATRSEEHTSELQSRPHLVCRLLLEKKKQTT